MLLSFENVFFANKKWRLVPKKHPRASPHHFSSKALLPYALFEELCHFDYSLPYLFEISHSNGIHKTVCSVLDFALDKNEIHLPDWIFEQLSLADSPTVDLSHIRVESGTGVKLLPHSTDFLDVENPKVEMERGLQNYHVISYGDEIVLDFEDIGPIRFTVTQIYPEHLDSIYIVETDLNVDFEEPIGYKQKLEDERTVQKYLKVEETKGGEKIIKMERIGLFLDWDNLKTEEVLEKAN